MQAHEFITEAPNLNRATPEKVSRFLQGYFGERIKSGITYQFGYKNGEFSAQNIDNGQSIAYTVNSKEVQTFLKTMCGMASFNPLTIR